MKAMILAAGEGTRLRPLTATVPKPMVPIVGRPLLAWTLAWLAKEGVTEAAINLFHRPQAIPDFFGEEFCGIRLHYCYEETLRGTAGGVKGASRYFADAPFAVIYGDNLIQADLRRLAAFHYKTGAAVTLGLFSHPNPTAAGIVSTDEQGRITRFVEKPPPDQIFADTANAGVYVLDPSVLNHIPDDMPYDFGRDVFPALLEQRLPLYGKLLGGYLQDTGTPQQYRKANWDALAGKIGRQYADKRLWVGDHTEIAPSVSYFGRNIIGSGVTVGAGATLTDCIVWDGAKIGSGSVLTEAIIGQGAMVDAGVSLPTSAILA
jgi:NDP-sugar pyrophosphorylase family protein